jgi:uncharacterized protein YjiS (DUF1127 family)
MTTQDLFSKTNLNNENIAQRLSNRVHQWIQTQNYLRKHRKAMRKLEDYPTYLLSDIGLDKSDFSQRPNPKNRHV